MGTAQARIGGLQKNMNLEMSPRPQSAKDDIGLSFGSKQNTSKTSKYGRGDSGRGIDFGDDQDDLFKRDPHKGGKSPDQTIRSNNLNPT